MYFHLEIRQKSNGMFFNTISWLYGKNISMTSLAWKKTRFLVTIQFMVVEQVVKSIFHMGLGVAHGMLQHIVNYTHYIGSDQEQFNLILVE